MEREFEEHITTLFLGRMGACKRMLVKATHQYLGSINLECHRLTCCLAQGVEETR